MAKKKKATSNWVKFQNVKTTAKVDSQSLGYSGKVTLKLQKDGYTVKTINTHNSATLRLLSGMAQLLAGAFNQPNQSEAEKNQVISRIVPKYLGIGNEPSPTPTNPAVDTRLHGEYPINRIKLDVSNPMPDSTGRKYTITYSAVINYSMIGAKPINELGLYASEPYEDYSLLARVMVSDGSNNEGTSSIQLAVGMNLLVEWTITLQNT